MNSDPRIACANLLWEAGQRAGSIALPPEVMVALRCAVSLSDEELGEAAVLEDVT